jgi:hypothetical protein
MLALLAAVCGSSGAQQPGTPAAPPAPPVIPSRQNVFVVPFQIAASKDPREQAAEVQLHVSADYGANWRVYQRVKPDLGKFVFRAEAEGEYWFAVRTKDAAGRVRPEGKPHAELRVLVDTVAPVLHLEAWQGPAGEITARWEVADRNLDPKSLKLEYRRAGRDEPWQRVAIEQFSHQAIKETYVGQVSWLPGETKSPWEVRAEITDLAGNPAVHTVQVADEPPARPAQTQKPQPSGSSPPGPPAAGATAAGATASAASSSPTTPAGSAHGADTQATAASRTTPVSAARTGSAPADGHRMSGTPWPADNTHPLPGGPAALPGQGTLPLSQPPHGMVPGPLARSGSRDRPWMLNSAWFEYSYRTGVAEPADIRSIELWCTSDGGETWRRIAVDDDKQSPILVHVEGEGRYGFRLLVLAQNGSSDFPPGRGESPESWAVVDLTRPLCQLVRAEQSPLPDTRELVIEWESSDAAPAARPATLLYAPQPEGPWHLIATELEPSGRFAWRLDDRLPDSLYLRLEVHDAAGNVATTTRDLPVSLERPSGEGRLQSVRPVPAAEPGSARLMPRIEKLR